MGTLVREIWWFCRTSTRATSSMKTIGKVSWRRSYWRKRTDRWCRRKNQTSGTEKVNEEGNGNARIS